MQNFRNLLELDKVKEFTEKDFNKVKVKLVNIRNNKAYFNVKGNSFYMVMTKLSNLNNSEIWTSDWYSVKDIKDAILIETNNLTDIIVDIKK